MIRLCGESDFNDIHQIINDASMAYRGVIPADRWHEPYMSEEELQGQIADGVVFWGFEENGALIGIMGIQDKGDVALIRHAYVRTVARNKGIGGLLLQYICSQTSKPVLIGTWKAAVWAVSFYQKHGFRLVTEEQKDRLLKKYWSIPERQVETSVVLADAKWIDQ